MNIVKKNKAYYLKHSFRKEGRVITKERYLGKKIPGDIERLKKKFLEECNQEYLYPSLEKIKNEFQKEWKKYPKSMQEKVTEQIAVAFTYNTNAIEGSTITLEETQEILEHNISPNKPLRDVKETEAHAKIFLTMLQEKKCISIDLLLRWHKQLFQDTKQDISGKFRDYLIKVGVYRAPDWQDVAELMKSLMVFYNKNSKMHPIELAGRMHYRFEKIHPFGDGNGRIGRLLMNSILWKSGYPMLIIEYKKRKAYYKALEKDEGGFLQYFIRTYVKVHKKHII